MNRLASVGGHSPAVVGRRIFEVKSLPIGRYA
jgi:hypothetical protein